MHQSLEFVRPARHQLHVQRELEPIEWIDSPQYGRICGFAGDEVLFSKVKNGALWEPHAVNRFAEHIRPGSIAIDCGTNIGLHSLAMLARQPEVGQIIALEPHPEIYEVLVANTMDRPKIVQLNRGAGSEDCVRSMPSLNKSINPAGARLNVDTNDEHLVLVTRIDSLNLQNVSFMKIDVEGDEMKVIEGALRLISEQKPNLIVEMLHNQRGKQIDRIQSLGYKADEFSPNDVLFVPD